MRPMWVAAIVLVLASGSGAQDQTTNPEELTRKLADAQTQLKAAQDRKNELANENEKLSARLADLEKQLAEAKAREASFNERTWFLRSHYAAWQTFLRQRPALLIRWRQFIESDPLAAPSSLPETVDPTNPLAVP